MKGFAILETYLREEDYTREPYASIVGCAVYADIEDAKRVMKKHLLEYMSELLWDEDDYKDFKKRLAKIDVEWSDSECLFDEAQDYCLRIVPLDEVFSKGDIILETYLDMDNLQVNILNNRMYAKGACDVMKEYLFAEMEFDDEMFESGIIQKGEAWADYEHYLEDLRDIGGYSIQVVHLKQERKRKASAA